MLAPDPWVGERQRGSAGKGRGDGGFAAARACGGPRPRGRQPAASTPPALPPPQCSCKSCRTFQRWCPSTRPSSSCRCEQMAHAPSSVQWPARPPACSCCAPAPAAAPAHMPPLRPRTCRRCCCPLECPPSRLPHAAAPPRPPQVPWNPGCDTVPWLASAVTVAVESLASCAPPERTIIAPYNSNLDAPRAVNFANRATLLTYIGGAAAEDARSAGEQLRYHVAKQLQGQAGVFVQVACLGCAGAMDHKEVVRQYQVRGGRGRPTAGRAAACHGAFRLLCRPQPRSLLLRTARSARCPVQPPAAVPPAAGPATVEPRPRRPAQRPNARAAHPPSSSHPTPSAVLGLLPRSAGRHPVQPAGHRSHRPRLPARVPRQPV